MAEIQHVQQTDAWGCAFAAVAMLTGRSYEDVKVDIRSRFKENEHRKALGNGMNHHDVEVLLHEAGYWGQLKYRWYFNNQERAVWPPEPWAEVHLCQVVVSETSPGAHFVIMLADGAVRDPLGPEPRKLSDYFKTQFVIGLVRC